MREMHKTADFHSNMLVSLTEGYQEPQGFFFSKD